MGMPITRLKVAFKEIMGPDKANKCYTCGLLSIFRYELKPVDDLPVPHCISQR